jgi:hypothetical protein
MTARNGRRNESCDLPLPRSNKQFYLIGAAGLTVSRETMSSQQASARWVGRLLAARPTIIGRANNPIAVCTRRFSPIQSYSACNRLSRQCQPLIARGIQFYLLCHETALSLGHLASARNLTLGHRCDNANFFPTPRWHSPSPRRAMVSA